MKPDDGIRTRMGDLTKFPNIGPVLAGKLKQIGVRALADLIEMGSIEATIRIGASDLSACFNMLYALEGAISGIRWHDIPKGDREKLKADFKLAIDR
jgi:DNA transformation protein